VRAVRLRQLEILAALAAQPTLARAAAALHLTPSAVSQQIAALARAAGAPVLERVGRRLVLTPAGEVLARAAAAVQAELRRAAEELAAQRGLAQSLLSVGVISAGDSFLPALLARYCEGRRGVRVALAVCNREELIRRLVEDRCDLAVMSHPPAASRFLAVPFATHPIVLVAPAGHPLAQRQRLALGEALAGPVIAREPGSVTRAAMDELLRRARLHVSIAFETASNETIKQAVIAGFGVAFLSAHAIGAEVREGRLAVLDVRGLPVRRRWYTVVRRGRRLPPAAAGFATFLHEEGERELLRTVPKELRALWSR